MRKTRRDLLVLVDIYGIFCGLVQLGYLCKALSTYDNHVIALACLRFKMVPNELTPLSSCERSIMDVWALTNLSEFKLCVVDVEVVPLSQSKLLFTRTGRLGGSSLFTKVCRIRTMGSWNIFVGFDFFSSPDSVKHDSSRNRT